MRRFSHLDADGQARMVDVSGKLPSRRRARVEGYLQMSQAAFAAITAQALEKGDAYAVAKVAGLQAAKRTAELIPLCHPLPIDHVEIAFEEQDAARTVRVEVTVTTTAKTGIEMEALTAASVALLALYDMVKALDASATIVRLRLLEKVGGKLGYRRDETEGRCAPPS